MRLTAGLLVLALQFQWIALASGDARLFGTIVSGKSHLPVVGARVHAASASTGRIVSSVATGADGRYELVGLPAGEYSLSVEAGAGLYLVDSSLGVTDGASRRLNLSLKPGEIVAGPGARRGGAASVWNNPLTATLIVVGGAVGVGLLVESATDDNPLTEPCASPPCP